MFQTIMTRRASSSAAEEIDLNEMLIEATNDAAA